MAGWLYPENPGLLAGVIADPDADAPRLVYADWLEEQGDLPRAEFIRTSCELADKSAADPAYPGLVERHTLALGGLRLRRMKPPLPPEVSFRTPTPTGAGGFGDSFHRGFPFEVAPTLPRHEAPLEQWFQAFLDALRPAFDTTTVRGLNLCLSYPYMPDYRRVLACSDVVRIRALRADNAFAAPNALIPTLAVATDLPLLTWLAISELRPGDLPHLRSPVFEKITRLDLTELGLPERDAEGLGELAIFQRLRRLSVGLYQDNVSAALSAFSTLPDLHDLTVRVHPGIAAGSWWLCDFPALAKLIMTGVETTGLRRASPTTLHMALGLARMGAPRLATLEFRAVSPLLDDLREMTAADWWPQLRILRFADAGLPAGGAALVADSSCGPCLRVLEINGATREITPVLERGRFPKLSTLELHRCFHHTQSQELLWTLANAELPNLTRLSLQGALLEDAGARIIATNATFGRLRSLDLSHCGISEHGIEALLASPHLAQLQQLRLVGNTPGVKVAEMLCDPDVMPGLIDLELPIVQDSKLYQRLRELRPMLFY